MKQRTDQPGVLTDDELRGLSPDELVDVGQRAMDEQRPFDARRIYTSLAEQVPDDPAAQLYLALACFFCGRNDEALEALDVALRLDGTDADAHLIRGEILLEGGRYVEGWQEIRWRYRLDPEFEPPSTLPEWKGEDFAGKDLLVFLEGGHGDTMWASRFLPLVKTRGGSVYLRTRPSTRRLFAHLQGVDGFVDDGYDETEFDCYTTTLCIPESLALETPGQSPLPTFYEAPPDAERAAAIDEHAEGRFKVGVIWSGSPGYGNSRRRSASLDAFLTLAENPDIQLFSLQKGPEQQTFRARNLGPKMVEIDDLDFADAASTIRSLDLIVMTDTALAHLAGSIGAPIWLLLAYRPFWYYGLQGDRCSWYPSMRLFRQPAPGDWPSVFASVGRSLANAVAAKRKGDWPGASFDV